MKPFVIIFGMLVALAMAAVVSSLVYAGLFLVFDKSSFVFQALENDLFAAYRLARLDVLTGQWTRPAIAGSAGVTVAVGIMLTAVVGKKKSTDARFLNPVEARALGLTKPGGVFVGRIGGGVMRLPGGFTQRGSGKRSWFRPRLVGGKKLWIDGDDVGGFVIGPPRSGKGASIIVPNCLLWPDSIIVLDMRGETYDATAGYRSMFSRVLRFSPADENDDTECYNPLDFVAIDPDQRDIDITSIATALLPTPKGDPYWISDARALFAGVTSWVLENPDVADKDKNIGTVLHVVEGGDKPLRTWLTEVALPELRADWISSFTYTTITRFSTMADKQFDGVYGTLAAAVRPFKNNRILRATSKSTFDIRAMRRQNMSLYLDFRIQQIASIGPIFNVLMVQFMDYMSRDLMKAGERRVLVLLDEFQNLGKLENALTAATVLGGYGVPCWFFVQSLRSIDNVYTREGRQTLVNSARAQIFLGAQDPEDQRYVSQLLGEKRETSVDRSVSTGITLFDHKGSTISHKTVMRPLMRPDELGSMDEMRCIIKLRNQRPIFGIRNLYYADRALAEKAWLPLQQATTDTAMSDVSARNSALDTKADLKVQLDLERSSPTEPGARFRARMPALTAKAFVPKTEQAKPRLPSDRHPAAKKPITRTSKARKSSTPAAAKKPSIPDFKAAMTRTSERRRQAEVSVSKILSVLNGDPDKADLVGEVEQDIASAFSET